jgi:ferredoxin
MRHQRSNYELKLNLDTCKACGLCVKRCPVDAMIPGEATAASPNTADSSDQKALKKPVHVPEKCIGCGVCAHKCPTQSIALVRRETEEDIAETLSELGLRMLLERGVDPKKVF